MPIRDVKIVIMGSGGVGKSAITVRFVHDFWVERYDPTIEDSYRKLVTVDGTRFQCEILDTAGTEQFMSLHSLYMRSGDGFILVFSLTSLESLHELPALREQIVRAKEGDGFRPEKVPVCLVGNKSDLAGEGGERQVPKHYAKDIAKQWGNTPYIETSARNNVNITLIFDSILRQFMKMDDRNRATAPPPRKKKDRKCIIL